MYKITWDKDTGGILLHSRIVEGTLGVSPRPVFYEELDLLKLNEIGWKYPQCEGPLLWAINKQYYYRGDLVFETKGANIYDPATVIIQPGFEKLTLVPVDIDKMLDKCKEFMFLLESEAIEFIHETYIQYAGARKSVDKIAANQIDYELLAQRVEKKKKTKMAIVKEDCESFDIVPLEEAEKQGKKVYQTTRIDRFLASFSGGKDSQVVLDLCTRAIPSTDFEVIYSDTGYELPPSLSLYDDVQKYYTEKYPDLKFSTTKNHEPVLSYWDKIGTPSDTHRWCCSIMKTAPLYRTLKVEGTNKQAKVLTFDGVRAEESLKRGNYERLGKGKHTNIHNAHPIILWNAVEIFLYLFKYNLPINQAYRNGKSRVGCLICPFSTAWDDMIATRFYPQELEPFTKRLIEWSHKNKITNVDEFLKERKWKIKAIGDTELLKTSVAISDKNNTFTATVNKAQLDLHTWLPTLGSYSVVKEGSIEKGQFKYDGSVYTFEIKYNSAKDYTFIVHDPGIQLSLILRRLVNKCAFCVQCEVCEVDCPTGALSIVPNVNIDKNKCVHCLKCLNSHDCGCIAADSVRMIKDMNNNANAKIQAYKTFGFREEWLNEYLVDPEYFWKSNSLGTAQVDGFKAWLKDAEIIDAKNNITELGLLLQEIYIDEPDMIWEIILTNLSYNSFIVRWFINNIKIGQEYDRKSLESMIGELGFSVSAKTISNAVAALLQSFDYSPFGDSMKLCQPFGSKTSCRLEYQEISKAGLAYNLYKYAEKKGVRSLRVSDFYGETAENGPYKTLGISKQTFISTLKALNSATNRVLIADLNMGQDSINLRDDLTPLSCLKSLL